MMLNRKPFVCVAIKPFGIEPDMNFCLHQAVF
jgi:hypothetical protein